MERTKEFAKIAHRHGVKVLGYCQFNSLYYEAMLDEVPNLEQWTARKMDGSILTYGTEPFDSAYREGAFDKLITTNLVYQPQELLEKPYYVSCDMSKFLALIIDTLNHDSSLSSLLNPMDRIKRVITRYENGEKV